MLTAIAAFAEAFANPLAPALVLGLALLRVRPAMLRLASAGLGGVLALPHLAAGTEIAPGLAGSIAAMLLYAELTLHFVLPAFRFVRRCLVVTWELTVIVTMMLSHLRRRSRLLPPVSGDKPPPPPPKDRS